MGEWLKQVPVKLTQESIEAIDEIRAAQPFEVGRSTVARGIIERFLSLMACGIVTFAADENNRVLSNSGRQRIPADSKEVASPEVTTPTKPPVRVAARRGRPFAAMRLVDVAEATAYKSLPFPAMCRRLNFSKVAA